MGGTALGNGELGWCPVVKDPGKQRCFSAGMVSPGWHHLDGIPAWNRLLPEGAGWMRALSPQVTAPVCVLSCFWVSFGLSGHTDTLCHEVTSVPHSWGPSCPARCCPPEPGLRVPRGTAGRSAGF